MLNTKIMGLDMYAYKVTTPDEPSPIHLITEADYKPFEGSQVEEFFYWRKHPNLQGWMEKLWRAKGGQGEFNCVDVELNAAHLDQLEYDVRFNQLPDTVGFFFGENSDDYYTWQDQEFIREARQYLADGYKVVYTSWW